MTGADHHFKPLQFIHPKYLPTWVGLGLLWLISRLPYGVILAIGRLLGRISFYLLPGRRRIVRTNIRLCFPELDERAIQQLAQQNFMEGAIALLESPLAWWGSDQMLQPLHTVEGLEYLEAAKAKGKGVILLGAHYTTLEIGGRLLAYHIDWRPTFKRAHNKLFNAVMARSRKRVHGGLLHSSDMRAILRYLGENGTIWYAPDQDFGRKGAVFAPFMGVAASSLTMTTRLAKKSGAAVLPMYSERLPGTQGYIVRIGKPLALPSGDEVADAGEINRAIEEQVRRAPAQYLWAHRRFKTRPYGEPLLYAPKKDPALRRYGMVMPLLAPLLLIHAFWMAFKHRDLTYLLQRLGLQLPTNRPDGLWLHAASVGEVNAVMPLIKALHTAHPDLPITLTTATPTGGANARAKLPPGCVQHFLPLDWLWLMRRFSHRLAPRCLLVVETEMWPNLFWQCFKTNIPIIMINGRLSERTRPKNYWLRRLYCSMSQQLRFVFARNEADRDRFLDFGTPEECIKVMGNIKLAAPAPTDVAPYNPGRQYILAASTRDDEEWRIVQAWQTSAQRERLLVIAPRHPHRLETILKQLAPLTDQIAVRSRQEPVTAETRIYLADTLGELPGFIAGSEFVIMGGSFVPLGGQNILEAGMLGKAVVFGPHMHNFKDEAALFVEHQAGVQLTDIAELPAQIDALSADQAHCTELGRNGQLLMQGYAGMIDRYVTDLGDLCPTHASKAVS
ncbi:MAG: hypothetical protein OEZ39_08220 [Gammaproteobacteria bacterium]|nr:hypothetical protein [Gammaproteobacteria bacterium]MDH5651846.1 hypothetical protein [Gammaproteobacteria bacterium]